MSRARTLRRTAGVAVLVVAVDQATKAIVRGALDRGDRRELLPFLDLVNVRNTGVAFGLLADGGVLLIAGAARGARRAARVRASSHSGRPLVWLPAGLLLGGAAGNLLDRVRGRLGDRLPQAPRAGRPSTWPTSPSPSACSRSSTSSKGRRAAARPPDGGRTGGWRLS